jgi:hypothetical protein
MLLVTMAAAALLFGAAGNAFAEAKNVNWLSTKLK